MTVRPAAVVLALLVTGCGGPPPGDVMGSGHFATETRALTDFSSVGFGGGVRGEVRTGPADTVEVEAEDNILPLVLTNVSRGVLSVGVSSDCQPSRPVVVRVTVRSLEAVDSHAAASVTVGPVEATSLSLRASTGGTITVERVASGSVEVAGSTSSAIRAAGTADRLSVAVNTSGFFDGEHLTAKECTVIASTGAAAAVRVTKSLDVKANGGRVKYFGSPEKLTEEAKGGGVVQRG